MSYQPASTTLLFFDYGQRAAAKEWHATRQIARILTSRFVTADAIRVELDWFKQYARSALLELGPDVTKLPVPGVAHEWTPARNTVFMALGVSFAEAQGLSRIVTGINRTAALAYPDNSEGWHNGWSALLQFAVDKGTELEIESPLMFLSKTQIVQLGEELNIPWGVDTWSCYEGGKLHCGKCSSCRARRTAFADAKIEDFTEYEAESE